MLAVTQLIGFGSGSAEELDVRDSTTSVDSFTTSHVVSMPTNVVNGDTLLAGVSLSALETITWPVGWDELQEQTSGGTMAASIAVKLADGTEGGTTITVTAGGIADSAHFSYSIKGAADPGGTPPDIASAAGSSSTPDPPPLTPASTKQYLWVATAGIDVDSINGFPTNYDDNQVNSDEGSVAMAAATRILSAASENPGTFSATASDEWAAFTIAVHPA